jgi:hypothetical protein
VATGIDDIVVGGGTYNVTFTQTLPPYSLFAFSDQAAAPGQPLTGVDAGNALISFLKTQLEPDSGLVTTGPFFTVASQVDPVTGLYNLDVLEAVFEGTTLTVPGDGGVLSTFSEFQNPCIGECTVWTPVAPIAPTAAPEISPALAPAGLTLLLGTLAVLRGRRKVVNLKVGARV